VSIISMRPNKMRAWDWPRNVLKRNGGETESFREIASIAPILVSAAAAAVMLGVSKRSFHRLRKRKDFPQNATVVFGARCVRYRREALQAFAQSFASAPQGEPEQLKRGRRIRLLP
jgi:predicted DNA-binding transcriptional regulator AlpA